MIISHSKQVCFWKIPRTGSTTVDTLIRLLGGLDETQDVVAEEYFFPSVSHNADSIPDHPNGTPGRARAHLTPQEAIDSGVLTLAQYNSYQNFCMVRDPVSRFKSMYQLALPSTDWNARAILRDTVVANENGINGVKYSTWRKQVDWLTVPGMNAMPFSDYVNSVNTILTAFGITPPNNLPNISRRHMLWQERVVLITPQVEEDAIRAYYSEDALLNT